jgi:hypothetical protein
LFNYFQVVVVVAEVEVQVVVVVVVAVVPPVVAVARVKGRTYVTFDSVTSYLESRAGRICT